MCLWLCAPAYADSLPPVPVDLAGYDYILQLNAAGDAYTLLILPGDVSNLFHVSDPPFTGGWASEYTWINSYLPFRQRFTYKIGSEGWVESSEGLTGVYTNYVYGSGDYIVGNSIPILDNDFTTVVYPVQRLEEVRFGYEYDSSVPTPANVRYVKTGEKTSELVWDNNDPEDKYDVVLRAVFHWKNVNPVGSWIQDNIPFTGDASGDLTFQLLDSSDGYGVKNGYYITPASKLEEIKEAIAKEAKKNTSFFSWYISEFHIQYVGYNDKGQRVFGNTAICKVNWSNVKKGDWTSSTTIFSGAVKDDTGVDGDQSTTHPTDWGDIKGGGGASFDGDSTDYDSSGNIIKTDSADNVLKDFINSLVNVQDVLNRFFQTLQILMSGISQLPAFFSLVVSFMPPEFTSLLVTGLGVVILLRIFGR